MESLIVHAKYLGVEIHSASLTPPLRGLYEHTNRRVIYDVMLTPVARRSVIAHELWHAYHGHACRQSGSGEDAADLYAALLLIDPTEYASAERLHPSPVAIGRELGVESRLVEAYQRRALVRLGVATYVRSRMGEAQFSYREVSALG